MRKRLAGILFVAAAAVTALGFSTTSAVADATLTVSYPVNGTTSIATTGTTLTLGPGTLDSTADLTTGTLTGTISLPPATGTFTEFGIVPVTVTASMGTTSGFLRDVHLVVAGVGNQCHTSLSGRGTFRYTNVTGVLSLSGVLTVASAASCPGGLTAGGNEAFRAAYQLSSQQTISQTSSVTSRHALLNSA